MKQFIGSYIGKLLLILVLIVVGGWQTPERHEVVLESESKLWIEGSSSVNDFRCNAEELAGHARFDQAGETQQTTQARAEVVVPVRRFDCGQRRMDRDLHDAMKSSEHPFIRYELEEGHLIEHNGDTYRLQVTGRLMIAGTERSVTLDVRAERLSDGRFRARGSQMLSMSNFGIDPPTVMLGLIKVRDEIEVHFDLFASRPVSQKSAEARQTTTNLLQYTSRN